MWHLLLIVIVFLLAKWWFQYARIPAGFPTGPYGLPIVGYFPIFVAENIVSGFEALHKRFGPNFSLNIGMSDRIVVIGDYETLRVMFFFNSTPFSEFKKKCITNNLMNIWCQF
jgi:hypothetical protein